MVRRRVIKRAINKNPRAAMNDWDGRDLELFANWDKFMGM